MPDYGNSGAPVEGTIAPEERRAAVGDVPATQAAHQTFQEETVAAPVDEALVSYVAAGEYANRDFLVVAGKPVAIPITAGSTPGVIPLIKREGDVWAKFSSGVLVTDDPRVIKWCDEHPTICRRSDDPMTKGWSTLKELQTRRANREQLLDPTSMDADESFPPNMMDGLREQAAKPDSPGGKLVESAELTKRSIEE